MPTIRDPLLFSEHFAINPDILRNIGVFNPLLNIDTNLFIDPLLLEKSIHVELHSGGVDTYLRYFNNLIKLLALSKKEGDVPWRNAERLFKFPEIKGTCLGYGASSIHGSAWGPELRKRVLHTAKEIIDLGVNDSDLFLTLALFENGVGPDRISDMVTNIILQDLIAFNSRIISTLGLQLQQENFIINGVKSKLLRNPLEKISMPIVLLPQDILRELPIARDWSEVGQAAWENEILRKQVSEQVGEIWESKVHNDKEMIKEKALASKESFLTLLNTVKSVQKIPYDFILDKKGEVAWMRLLEEKYLTSYPLDLKLNKTASIEDVFKVVKQIVSQFAILIENKGLWKELWAGKKLRPEKSAQRLFFAIADTYCKANGIDLTPEADSGSGPVDFKFSFGYDVRLLVEIKLSSNPNVVSGYDTQLEIYKSAESTTRAIYLVIDVGRMGDKDQKILDIKNEVIAQGLPASEIIFVDGKQKLSASKRKAK